QALQGLRIAQKPFLLFPFPGEQSPDDFLSSGQPHRAEQGRIDPSIDGQAMSAFVSSECAARATANHTIDGTVIVARARQPTLDLQDERNISVSLALVHWRRVALIYRRGVVSIRIVAVVRIRIVKRKAEVEKDEVVETT